MSSLRGNGERMMQMAEYAARIGAVFYVLWGVFHLVAANAVYALAEQSAGMVRARLLQDAFYLLFFAVAGIVVAVILNWRNDKPACFHGAVDDECWQNRWAAACGRHFPQHVSIVAAEIRREQHRIAARQLPRLPGVGVGVEQRLVILEVGWDLRFSMLPEIVRAAADRVPDRPQLACY